MTIKADSPIICVARSSAVEAALSSNIQLRIYCTHDIETRMIL